MENKISLFKKLGVSLVVSGFSIIKNSHIKLIPTQQSFGKIKNYIDNVIPIPVSQRDFTYYLTTWNNWEGRLAVIWNIIKPFKWIAEKFDCDDRSKIVSALCSLFFGLNTCGELYCKVRNIRTGKEVLHWTNIIITSNGDIYLFDVDNGGLTKKLEYGQPISMGKWYYVETKAIRL